MVNIRVGARGIVVRDNAILLIECFHENWHFNIPGGGVNFGESMREAVKREVYEETTLDVEVHELLFVYEHVEGEHHMLLFFFQCTAAPDALAQMPPKPDTYQRAVIWIPLELI